MTMKAHHKIRHTRTRHGIKYKLNYQVSLNTMVMGVGREETTTCLGILDFPGSNSNIGHHVLKFLDNNIGPIIQDMAYKEINQNSADEVLLTLEHGVDLLKKLI